MINLIPPAAKKQFRREYWLRVTVVWLWLLCGALLLAAAFTAPAFVLVQSQLVGYETEIASASAAANEQAELSKTVAASNKQAETVLDFALVPAIMPYIEQVEVLQPAGVSLSRVSVMRDGTDVGVITVTGVAVSRQSLTDFSAALVADRYFTQADVPLANLAANEDISFSLDIVVADPDTTL